MAIIFNIKITAAELGASLGLKVQGDGTQVISNIGSLDYNYSNILKFSSKTHESYLNGIVIGGDELKAETHLISENPRLDFCRALDFLLNSKAFKQDFGKSNINSSAFISSSAIVEDSVTIGANTIVEHNVVIHKGTIIGENCIIRANSVIGAQGFGFEKNEAGKWFRFPHLGGVIIGNDVEIGALNSVCIGALDDTIIGNGVKTDNLVHIAHNCKIGNNCILTACTELSGGVTLGDNVWMGPNSSTMQKIIISDDVVVGVGSTVTKSVDKGNVVAGSPAKIIRRG